MRSPLRFCLAVALSLRSNSSEGRAMDTTRTLRSIIAAELLCGGAVVGAIGLSDGTAQANPFTWCPGQPMLGMHGSTGGPGLGVQWD